MATLVAIFGRHQTQKITYITMRNLSDNWGVVGICKLLFVPVRGVCYLFICNGFSSLLEVVQESVNDII